MQETIQTYNKAAHAYAQKFNTIGSRTEDVQMALALWGGDHEPRVIEWGCGNGRDAEAILAHTRAYIGIDASTEMIRLAQQQTPSAQYVVADMLTYSIPAQTDVIFAFAALLHASKEELRQLLVDTHERLATGGIVYISLKKAPYEGRVITDSFGPRLFYFYELSDIEEVTHDLYEIIHYDEQQVQGVAWFTCAIRKK